MVGNMFNIVLYPCRTSHLKQIHICLLDWTEIYTVGNQDDSLEWTQNIRLYLEAPRVSPQNFPVDCMLVPQDIN